MSAARGSSRSVLLNPQKKSRVMRKFPRSFSSVAFAAALVLGARSASAANVCIALDEANRTGVIKPGNNVLLVAFGAGFTWAASVVRW